MSARHYHILWWSIGIVFLLILGNTTGLLPITRYRESYFVAYRENSDVLAERAGMSVLSRAASVHTILPFLINEYERGPSGEYSLTIVGFSKQARIVAESFYQKNGKTILGSNSGVLISGCATQCRIVERLPAGLELSSLERYALDVEEGGHISHFAFRIDGVTSDVVSTPLLLELTN